MKHGSRGYSPMECVHFCQRLALNYLASAFPTFRPMRSHYWKASTQPIMMFLFSPSRLTCSSTCTVIWVLQNEHVQRILPKSIAPLHLSSLMPLQFPGHFCQGTFYPGTFRILTFFNGFFLVKICPILVPDFSTILILSTLFLLRSFSRFFNSLINTPPGVGGTNNTLLYSIWDFVLYQLILLSTFDLVLSSLFQFYFCITFFVSFLSFLYYFTVSF